MKVDGVYSAVQQNMGIEKAKDSYTGKSFLEVCEDIATENMAGVQAVVEENEYAGMTEFEIYIAIKEKYEKLYGDDFLDSKILRFSPRSYEEGKIMSDYYLELKKHIGDYPQMKVIIRTGLYGDMTDEEIRAKLTDKYVKPNMTYEDFLRMTYEMAHVGVDEGLREVATVLKGCDENGRYLIELSLKERNEYYMAMLDKPLNPNRIALGTNAIHFANNRHYKPMTTKLVSQIFNIPIGSDGYLDIPEKTENVDLQELYWNRYMKQDLLQEWWMNI